VELRPGEPALEFAFELGHFGEADRIDGRDADGAFDRGLQLVERRLELVAAAQDIATEIAIQASAWSQ
jgi:hypothetical protein